MRRIIKMRVVSKVQNQFITTAMTASSKRVKTKARTTKVGTTRARTQTGKGKYNARNQKPTPKRVTEGSELDESSSEEETRRPHKKRSKLTEEIDSEERGCDVEDIVEVTSGNGSESDFRVSARCFLCKTSLMRNLTCEG
jgi:hypothetical protein